MTFSIVVRERDSDSTVFGVGATTNNPGIGIFCPFVSANGAVATQYETHGRVGPRILAQLKVGETAAEAVESVLSKSGRSPKLQVHALCDQTRGVHTGDELDQFHRDSPFEYGMVSGTAYSVAGNCLAGRETLEATARAYEAADPERPLAPRLIAALQAGDAAGGDGRDLAARSAAIEIVDPDAPVANEWYNDVRVDASPTPLADLETQYELAKSHHEEHIEG